MLSSGRSLFVKYAVTCLVLFGSACSSGQDKSFEKDTNPKSVRIVFYNVENLFDIYNDSLKLDDEFTPEGERKWDNHKFYNKINNLYKAIVAIGEWNPPAVAGLCEVENRFVLNKLVYQTPLKTFDYTIIHEESPDTRGIDVAMIYRASEFEPIYHRRIGIDFPFDTLSRTRDILYVKGVLFESDTVHFFVNHWPSRYGGYMETKPKREHAAYILRKQVDSLISTENDPAIIIMGDFNDEPWDESLKIVLKAKLDTSGIYGNDLYNLMAIYEKDKDIGTTKYLEDWIVIDQFILTASLVTGKPGLQVSQQGAQIFNPEFLLEEDYKYLGKKPFRTYTGFSYNQGFSDHLPIFIDLTGTKN